VPVSHASASRRRRALAALVKTTSPAGPPTHPGWMRCSSVLPSDDSPSSRPAGRAPPHPCWQTHA